MTLPLASTQQFGAGQLLPIPARPIAPGKPIAPMPAAGATGDANFNPVANQSNWQSNKDVSFDFNQLVAQIAAESGVPEAAPAPAASISASNSPAAKLPRILTAALPDQIPELPLPVSMLPAKRTVDKTNLLPTPAAVVRKDTRDPAALKTDPAGQPPVLLVDVMVPPPIPPKPDVPALGNEALAEKKPAETAPVSSVDEPAAMVPGPMPVLEVKIRLNQPDAPIVQNAAPLHAVTLHGANQAPANNGRQITNPVGQTLSPSGLLPRAASTIQAPVVVQARAAVPPSAPAVAQAAVSDIPLPVQSPPPVNADRQDLTREPVAAPGPAAAPVESAKQQNSPRGDADAGDSPPRSVPDEPARSIGRTARNQDVPVIASHLMAELGVTPPPANNSTTGQPAAMPSPPPTLPAPASARETNTEPPVSGAVYRQESPIDQTKTQQPMRALSLEFTPDGAHDIKVRLSERAGDVHISLHGTDPSLAGRVREGVSDLVGSLSRAGYDAEAWTPDQGRQQQRHQPEQRKTPPDTSGAPAAEEFGGLLHQPLQEIS